jgi:hypothetical protein
MELDTCPSSAHRRRRLICRTDGIRRSSNSQSSISFCRSSASCLTHQTTITPHHSCRNATIGSRFAARTAGYKPKMIPTAILIPTASPTLYPVTTVGICAK